MKKIRFLEIVLSLIALLIALFGRNPYMGILTISVWGVFSALLFRLRMGKAKKKEQVPKKWHPMLAVIFIGGIFALTIFISQVTSVQAFTMSALALWYVFWAEVKGVKKIMAQLASAAMIVYPFLFVIEFWAAGDWFNPLLWVALLGLQVVMLALNVFRPVRNPFPPKKKKKKKKKEEENS